MLRVSTLFSDHCVLPRGRELRIFGKTDQAAPVRVTLLDAAGVCLASAERRPQEGRFLVPLPAQAAQTGCTLRVTQGEEQFSAVDIAIGEVFLAGGQSNMELALCNARGGAALIAEDDPLLRYYNVPKRAIDDEATERENENTTWQRFTAGQGGDMSAVAAYFARRARAWTGVAIGIVDCYWGGTSITCWLSEDALRETGAGTRYLDEYAEKSAGRTMAQYLAEEAEFLSGMDAWNHRYAAIRAEHPDWSGTQVAQEAGPAPWFPPVGPGSPYRPAGLWNSMLCRLHGLAVSGILYYQGEEDAARTDRYDLLMGTLIRTWRALVMDENAPFIMTQLPRWLEAGREDTLLWPRIRAAQEAVYRQTRHTGLAVLIDQGEFDNIHPTDKQPVGDRLFEQAKTVIWHDHGEESPSPVKVRHLDDRMEIVLSAPVRVVADPAEGLLEVSADGEAWLPASADLSEDGTCLTLRDAMGQPPAAARYAWRDWCDPVYFAENGLPLRPFRV